MSRQPNFGCGSGSGAGSGSGTGSGRGSDSGMVAALGMPERHDFFSDSRDGATSLGRSREACQRDNIFFR